MSKGGNRRKDGWYCIVLYTHHVLLQDPGVLGFLVFEWGCNLLKFRHQLYSGARYCNSQRTKGCEKGCYQVQTKTPIRLLSSFLYSTKTPTGRGVRFDRISSNGYNDHQGGHYGWGPSLVHSLRGLWSLQQRTWYCFSRACWIVRVWAIRVPHTTMRASDW